MKKCMMCHTELDDNAALNLLFYSRNGGYWVCEICGEHVKNAMFCNTAHYEEAKKYIIEHTRRADYFVQKSFKELFSFSPMPPFAAAPDEDVKTADNNK